ncbi:TerC family protein [Paraburkholderia caballeronis]|uniref:Integral membrane protein, YjbE family n=1 Tax=Paraburkholderia caballeronis TaxID=416943 RepID=A0A1H7RTX8_9BURK|nr:TerC family protein [Paraburkholderia caballeronis]PXW23203.1 YjbE family integral membrane protein [Paraburkholderia caballeronis]PXW97867.1 YjbE family integral membrane protein [Paraburkholderia caballeronis]RAJ94837.1 YjbE family integral membrane protein [Paraburkholderia caballeronis]TDV11658.1 YjbE family integral membrane protein [Paraburkholderia caballeronis]TDV14739.1 YjbE family integral membrane protein [Paraburkholderia caballeronis]
MTLGFLAPETAQQTLAVLQIVFINVLLGGDNAIAIAMACRSLPDSQRRLGIWIGTALGVVLRVAMVGAIGFLLAIPYMHVAAALLLVWIGVQMLRGENGADDDSAQAGATALWRAVMLILFADFAMSLDNGLATAAVAETLPASTRMGIVLAGLAVGAPVIALGSTIMLAVLQRFPFVVQVGAALLGWIAGEMLLADPHVGDGLRRMLDMLGDGRMTDGATRIALCVLVAALVPLAARIGVRRPRAG